MTPSELSDLIGGIAPVIREYVDKSWASFSVRLKAVEDRPALVGDKGETGERGEKGETGERGERGDRGADGRDADQQQLLLLQAQINALVSEVAETKQALVAARAGWPADLSAAVAALPMPKDGRDGINGKDGQMPTAEDVAPIVAAEVARAVSLIELPKDGAPGKDGIGIENASIDKDGHLVLWLSDGTQRLLGKVIGRDGLPGVPGRWGDKGADGKDGLDGLGFDDVVQEFDGERRVTLSFARGDRKKTMATLVFPTVIDRGIWKEGHAYERGDSVSWGGSLFIAQRDTKAKPELSDDWRLAAKRGRDGKEGKPGKDGLNGKDGKDGVLR